MDMKIILLIILGVIICRVFFLYLEQVSLYYPEKPILETPKDLGISYEDVSFKTPDGHILNGWFVPAKGALVSILYCHGNAGNISYNLHRVKFFHELGMNFFIFDYRGYGKSTGIPRENGLYQDAQAAYDYFILRKDVDKDRIVIYGKSLGGAIAADLCLYRKAIALILDGSFTSVVSRGKQLYPFLPVKLLVTQKYDTLNKIKNIRVPKLIAHGRQDEVISFHHGEVLFEAAAEPKKFLPYEDGHNEDVYVTSAEFRKELERFFRDNGVL